MDNCQDRDRVFLPDKSKNNAIFVHALHKSASMFLYQLFKDLCATKKIPYFSINNCPSNLIQLNSNIKSGFCLCPERSFDLNAEVYPNLSKTYRIFQLRDPRDILVSQYFSVGWIHPSEEWDDRVKKIRNYVRGLSVDEYVLKAAERENLGMAQRSLKSMYEPILNLVKCKGTENIIVKYEEMIYNYKNWLLQVIKPFEFFAAIEPLIVQKYYLKYRQEFVVPTKENLTHKRKIIPGDYKEKLKPETIEQLNEIFKDILVKFNYL